MLKKYSFNKPTYDNDNNKTKNIIPSKYLKYGYLEKFKPYYRYRPNWYERQPFFLRKKRVFHELHIEKSINLFLELQMEPYPEYYPRRKVTRGKIRWKNTMLDLESRLNISFINVNKPWMYLSHSSLPLLDRIKTLVSQYYRKSENKTHIKSGFLKGIKGFLLKNAFLHKRKYLLRDTRFPDEYKLPRYLWQKKIDARFVFQRTKYEWDYLMLKYRELVLTSQLYNYKSKNKSLERKYRYTYRFFENHYMEHQLRPWQAALMLKRYLYKGTRNTITKFNKNLYLIFKPYNRVKLPSFEKKNKIFWWLNKLLWKTKHVDYRIQKNKRERIKELLLRLLLSFYGQLNIKNFYYLKNKTRKIKSITGDKWSLLLAKLELRLDVLIYRLNIAPSIFWAQELIKSGQIYIFKLQKDRNWISMYKNLWKTSFPLRLRDPKRLYCNNEWLYNISLSRIKFFLFPITNYNYIVTEGDFIYNSANSQLNKFYFNKLLITKPVPSHLMIQPESKFVWDPRTKTPQTTSLVLWEYEYSHPLNTVILFKPQLSDLPLYDRINRQYLEWINC